MTKPHDPRAERLKSVAMAIASYSQSFGFFKNKSRRDIMIALLNEASTEIFTFDDHDVHMAVRAGAQALVETLLEEYGDDPAIAKPVVNAMEAMIDSGSNLESFAFIVQQIPCGTPVEKAVSDNLARFVEKKRKAVEPAHLKIVSSYGPLNGALLDIKMLAKMPGDSLIKTAAAVLLPGLNYEAEIEEQRQASEYKDAGVLIKTVGNALSVKKLDSAFLNASRLVQYHGANPDIVEPVMTIARLMHAEHKDMELMGLVKKIAPGTPLDAKLAGELPHIFAQSSSTGIDIRYNEALVRILESVASEGSAVKTALGAMAPPYAS